MATGLAIAYLLGLLTGQLALVAPIGANANEFPKWSHRSARSNGPLITLAQRTGLLQPASHHAQHHRGMKNTAYCVVTAFTAPALDRGRLWAALERLVRLLTGVGRLPGLSLAPSAGPPPACLLHARVPARGRAGRPRGFSRRAAHAVGWRPGARPQEVCLDQPQRPPHAHQRRAAHGTDR